MPPLTIELDQALALRDQGALLIDVRTPAEFAETSIPGAVNVPLFDDGQRARVGTVYKEQGKAAARKLGVELVAPRIPALLEQVATALRRTDLPVIVFCWRGGMRSRALTMFLDLAGIRARQLIGGHKRFRAHVRTFLDQGQWGRLLVLRGLTGVGKTRLLVRLAGQGYPVLDLEALANHRGSAFGALGLPPQPSQKEFEALLWDALRKIPPEGFAVTEGESRNIGKLVLPPRVYEALQRETSLWIEASLDYRVQVLLGDYPAAAELKAAFVAPIRALKRRLGGETVERLLDLLNADDWQQLVQELMVRYYDPLYNHTKPPRRLEIPIEPEERGLVRLKEGIARLLDQEPGLN